MDVRKIEKDVDRDIAEMHLRAERSLKLRALRRKIRLFSLLFLFLFIVVQLVTAYALDQLIWENRANRRLTGAEILLTSCNFAISIMVIASLLNKLTRLNFRRSLVYSACATALFSVAGSLALYFWLTASGAKGAGNLIWLGPFVVGLGLPMGWVSARQYRKKRLEIRQVIRSARQFEAQHRQSIIEFEVKRQSWQEAEAQRGAQDAERDRLRYAVNYMKS